MWSVLPDRVVFGVCKRTDSLTQNSPADVQTTVWRALRPSQLWSSFPPEIKKQIFHNYWTEKQTCNIPSDISSYQPWLFLRHSFSFAFCGRYSFTSSSEESHPTSITTCPFQRQLWHLPPAQRPTSLPPYSKALASCTLLASRLLIRHPKISFILFCSSIKLRSRERILYKWDYCSILSIFMTNMAY